MPTWISLFLLCLLPSVHGAFTSTACDIGRNLCIQQIQGGSFCFYPIETRTTTYPACDPPYNLPLSAHLDQDYAIGYYTGTGQYLGRSDYPIPPGSPIGIYVCMSARVSTTQYYTICGRATADDACEVGCAAGVAPTVLDGCYDGPYRPGRTRVTETTTVTTTTTEISSSTILTIITSASKLIDVDRNGNTPTSTVETPAVPIPSASTSPKRDALKDSAFSIIWAPITLVLSIIGLVNGYKYLRGSWSEYNRTLV